ncbi:MAG: hypothetical protein ABI548_07225 [Polyangiaceae bacterium]
MPQDIQTNGEIDVIAHGVGENFPLDDSGEELDDAPADEKADPVDRRVELFFFDPEFGITPPPPGKNSARGSTEYPAWRDRTTEVVELTADELDGPAVIFAEISDAHFRTNSAVVLPEGENPDADGDHPSLTSVGVIAATLRFNEDHPGRTTLVAGHTDTTADPKFNQTLSEERAEVALAMLKGGSESRDVFSKLCNGRHSVADIKQILSWVASAFTGLSFDCDPGPIDDNGATLDRPVRQFQTDFNINRQALGSSAAALTVDGSVGALTWGGFFDCYEFALQQELGETAANLSTLRKKITFTDPDHEFLGFSEYFPIEELGVDNFRSQANRRVELLFFEPGEEPDLAHAAADPQTSELYLPGLYERTPLPPSSSGRRVPLTLQIVDHQGFPVPNTLVIVTLPDGEERDLNTDDQGALSDQVPPGTVAVRLTDGRFVHFGPEYANYQHDPVAELQNLATTPADVLTGNDSLDSSLDDFNGSMTDFTSTNDFTPLP